MLLLLRRRLQTSETYFDGIVEVLVETLSCVEAEDLDLKHREDTETENRRKTDSKFLPLIAASATTRGQQGEPRVAGRRTLIGSALLHWVTN